MLSELAETETANAMKGKKRLTDGCDVVFNNNGRRLPRNGVLECTTIIKIMSGFALVASTRQVFTDSLREQPFARGTSSTVQKPGDRKSVV